MKEIVILGGPNGAGKTSAAPLLFERYPASREFVNADEIARGLSPFNPEQAAIAAGRLMIARMKELVRREENFVLETTCSGRANLNLLRRCKADDWRISLLFLWLPSPQMAIDRVARRVSEGGHFVADDVVVRRYWAGLQNLHRFYLPLADIAAVYDNTDRRASVVAEKTGAYGLTIHDWPRWRKILETPQ